MKVTLKQLEEVVGRLGEPSKMPGYTWGIPAAYCKRGSKLRKKKGTVCEKCYALKNRYIFPNVQEALDRRLASYHNLTSNRWVETMAALISRRVKPDAPYFRIFDSGDLQSEKMLLLWFYVATLLPEVKFWMSTRERAIVKRGLERMKQPGNLVIRMSADMVGGQVPKGFKNTSGVLPGLNKKQWEDQVRLSNNKLFFCPAPTQDNECGTCRACWNKNVDIVVYKEH